jgi:hypothetical protein
VVDVQDDAWCGARPPAVLAAEAVALEDGESELGGEGIAGACHALANGGSSVACRRIDGPATECAPPAHRAVSGARVARRRRALRGNDHKAR